MIAPTEGSSRGVVASGPYLFHQIFIRAIMLNRTLYFGSSDIKFNLYFRLLIIVVGSILVTALVLLFMVVLLQDGPERVTAKPSPKTWIDPFEQIDIYKSPQELALRAQSRKSSSPDPYISIGVYTNKQSDKILSVAKSLRGGDKICFDQFIQDYQETLYSHCQKNELAQDVKGGCKEMAYKYSVHTRVVEQAIKNCVKK